MANYTDTPTRDTTDPNSSADMNTKQGNSDYHKNAHGFRNEVPNGNFTLWQRGDSFSNPTSGFLADNFAMETISGGSSSGTYTINKQVFPAGQTDVPDFPRYFMRWDQTVAGDRTDVRVTGFRMPGGSRRLAGKTVHFSFYYRCSVNFASTEWRVRKSYGSGGSPSATEDIGLGTINYTAANWALFSGTIVIPSDSGKTYGTDNNDVLFMDMPGMSEINTNICTFDQAQFFMFESNIKVPFFALPEQQELSRVEPFIVGYSNGSALVTAGANNNTWYNPTGHQLTLPSAGTWELEYHIGLFATPVAATRNELILKSTLSKASATEDDLAFTSAFHYLLVGDIIDAMQLPFTRRQVVTITAATTYYLNIYAYYVGGTLASLLTSGTTQTTVISARRLY
ncbi:MAG: hypothetical protein JRL30_27715 [Deltaproteobacteria bacterium]|nr:hypothetical protein [Deltaproteobacteria bacterium]